MASAAARRGRSFGAMSRRNLLEVFGKLGGLAVITLAAPGALSAASASQLVISEQQRLAVRAQSQRLYHSPSAIPGGNQGAALSIAEFFDYNCSVCRSMSDGLFDLSDSDTDIRLVFREYPVFGPDSEFAARAAIAARRQGKYIELHRALMRTRGRVGRHNVMLVAEKAGLDATQLTADMGRPEISASLAESLELARTLDVPGTPTYVVDDILIGGAPRDVLAALVQVVRSNRCNTCKT